VCGNGKGDSPRECLNIGKFAVAVVYKKAMKKYMGEYAIPKMGNLREQNAKEFWGWSNLRKEFRSDGKKHQVPSE